MESSLGDGPRFSKGDQQNIGAPRRGVVATDTRSVAEGGFQGSARDIDAPE